MFFSAAASKKNKKHKANKKTKKTKKTKQKQKKTTKKENKKRKRPKKSVFVNAFVEPRNFGADFFSDDFNLKLFFATLHSF